MGSHSPICQRAAAALADGGVVLLPSDGLYMALISVLHSENRQAVDALCRVSAQDPEAQELWAFVRNAHDLEAWGLTLPAAAQEIALKVWPGPLSFVYPEPQSDHLDAAFAARRLEVCCPEQSFMAGVLDALAELDDTDLPPMLAGLPAHRPGALPVSSGRWLARSLGFSKIAELVEQVPFVADAGPTRTGCRPTAVELRDGGLQLVRRGPVALETLSEIVGSELPEALYSGDGAIEGLELRVEDPPAPGLQPVQALPENAWAIGVGPRPKNCPDSRWIELREGEEPFVAEYFDALARAAEAGAQTIHLRLPSPQLRDRIGLPPIA